MFSRCILVPVASKPYVHYKSNSFINNDNVVNINFSTSSQNDFKVAVIGASGGIGQPLSLLLKLNPLVSELSLCDVAKMTPGVAVDLSHINRKAKVKGFVGTNNLDKAVKGAHLVLCPAGVPRKPGMKREDLFDVNAALVYKVAIAVACNAPNAVFAIITNPVNSVVPIAAEAMKTAGKFNRKKLLGVTTLDLVRAAAFVGKINGVDPAKVRVPCIGGHAGATIIPVLSQSNPPLKLCDQKQIEALTKRIQVAGTEVVKAKAGGGSATLSMAFAAARLANSFLRAFKGEKGICECAYVNSKVTAASFFANSLLLGKKGIKKNLGYGKLNTYEKKLRDAAVKTLQGNIKKGVEFAKKQQKK